ncbi:MAG: uracil phosphoribosyltransferase [Gillisia sp.]
MTDFFHGIAWLFENILFIPFDFLRHLQADTWWGANIISWIFLLIGAAAFTYWMLQLKKFHDEGDEDRGENTKPFLG